MNKGIRIFIAGAAAAGALLAGSVQAFATTSGSIVSETSSLTGTVVSINGKTLTLNSASSGTVKVDYRDATFSGALKAGGSIKVYGKTVSGTFVASSVVVL